MSVLAVFVTGLALCTFVQAVRLPDAGDERWFRIGVCAGLFSATAAGVVFLLIQTFEP